MLDSTLDQTLLVVYAVLWGAVTPGFARLRPFALNEVCGRSGGPSGKKARGRVWRRYGWGVLICNVGPVALLAVMLRWVPDTQGFWGAVAGGFLGITPAVFPRLLHAALASEQQWHRHYSTSERDIVLRAWNESWQRTLEEGGADRRANTLWAHLGSAGLAAIPPLAVGLLIAFVARGGPG